MNIIVCVKQVVDPEAPPSSFKVDSSSKRVVPSPGVPQVLSTFDGYAVEAAVKIKEAMGARISVVSLGVDLLREVVKRPLAMGADELILLEDPAFAGGDSWSTAFALAAAVRKIGLFDLLFCGRQAADWDSGQVGAGLAELLGLPSVGVARKIEIVDGKARVERVVSDGYEVVEVDMPVLVTFSNEHPAPRYPNIQGIMAAKKREPILWTPADIGLDPSEVGGRARRAKLQELFQPVRDTHCEMVGGDTPEEAAANLAVRLREERVI